MYSPLEPITYILSKLAYLYKHCNTGSLEEHDLFLSSSAVDKSLLLLLRLHSENKQHFLKITWVKTHAAARITYFSILSTSNLQ